MRVQTLQPSRNTEVAKRELHFLLADGERITVYAVEASKSRILLSIDAPETVKIHAGKLDFTD